MSLISIMLWSNKYNSLKQIYTRINSEHAFYRYLINELHENTHSHARSCAQYNNNCMHKTCMQCNQHQRCRRMTNVSPYGLQWHARKQQSAMDKISAMVCGVQSSLTLNVQPVKDHTLFTALRVRVSWTVPSCQNDIWLMVAIIWQFLEQY